ncbi:hypothetical protein EBI_25597 [Enterocytozoon bieneusi H348]|nr:hypothetical protein EBI_25597 [Enterocytozoon bieneusi H348]|eukprot:XP_002651418.1 hypothetical protein EBI_25597 [Enterocytozoon bieneusi H348]
MGIFEHFFLFRTSCLDNKRNSGKGKIIFFCQVPVFSGGLAHLAGEFPPGEKALDPCFAFVPIFLAKARPCGSHSLATAAQGFSTLFPFASWQRTSSRPLFFFFIVRLASKPVEFYLSDFQASLQKKESHRTVWRDEAGGKCWACSGSCAQGLWQAWQSTSGRGHGGTAVRRARDAWGMMSFRCSRRGTWRCPARVQGV